MFSLTEAAGLRGRRCSDPVQRPERYGHRQQTPSAGRSRAKLRHALWLTRCHLIVLRTVLLGLLLWCVLTALRSLWSRWRPPPTGVVFGQLRNCSQQGNGVCSADTRPRSNAAALAYLAAGREATEQRLLTLLQQLPGCRLERHEGDFWHATVVNSLFRFIDDVEFLFKDIGNKIDVRIERRGAWRDLGASRRLLETLRHGLEQPQ